jgi:hypothetical protein
MPQTLDLWGTLEGADFKTDQPLQFVEIGINLTEFGLDKRGEQSHVAIY